MEINIITIAYLIAIVGGICGLIGCFKLINIMTGDNKTTKKPTVFKFLFVSFFTLAVSAIIIAVYN